MTRITASTRTSSYNIAGTALSFRGAITDYVQYKNGPILSGLTNFSISLWFKTSTNPSGSGAPLYCERGSSGNDILKLDLLGGVNLGKIAFTYRDDAGTLNQVKTTNTYIDGGWHHAVITKSGTAIKVYVDNGAPTTGSLTATDTLTNATIDSRSGTDKGDAVALYIGYLDELCLYNVALSASEVSTLFGKSVVTNGLISRYSFDEAVGFNVSDSQGVNNALVFGASFVTGNVNKNRALATARTAASARTQTSIIIDSFDGSDSTAIDSHNPNLYPSTGWSQTASNSFYLQGNVLQPNRFTDGDIAVIESGVSDFSMSCVITPTFSGINKAFAGLVFRYSDSNNFWHAEINPSGFIDVYNKQSGTFTKVINYSTTVTSGTAITVRIDCIGNNIILYVNDTEITTYVSSFNNTATKLGVRIGKSNSPTNPSWNNFIVNPFTGTKYNWPLFTDNASNPIISRGASYDTNDANGPNVVFDPINNRYALYYSAYAGSSPQTAALAFSNSIGGAYTKYSGNPVFTSSDATGFGEDGGFVLWNGVYYKSYGRSSDHKIGMATSTDLVNWTDQGEVVPLNCPGFAVNVSGSFLRITQDNSTMQLWYSASNFVGFVTSTDGINFTKGAGYQLLNKTTGVYASGIYSVSAYVPPGKEGTEYLITLDTFTNVNNNRRVLTQYISTNGGTTWHERYAAIGPSGSGWKSHQVFDSFPLVINGTMYMFYCAGDVDGGTVNLNGQIGFATAPWPYTTLIGS